MSELALETSRLRDETTRIIRLSQHDRENAQRLCSISMSEAGYRIVPCGTEPETWALERVCKGTAPEVLMLFDAWAEAAGRLESFLRNRPAWMIRDSR